MRVESDLGGMVPKIDDAPWPGFPPDLTSIMTVVATQVEGTVLIHEKMFESRMFFVDKLIGMGARIILCDPHRAVVSGRAASRARPSALRREGRHGHGHRGPMRRGIIHHPQRVPGGTGL
jgi:UDP-N-acetylglucosamine enolpyruvyl transferase